MPKLNLTPEVLLLIAKGYSILPKWYKNQLKKEALREVNLTRFKNIYETVEQRKMDLPTFTKFIKTYIEKYGMQYVKAVYMQCGKLPKL